MRSLALQILAVTTAGLGSFALVRAFQVTQNPALRKAFTIHEVERSTNVAIGNTLESRRILATRSDGAAVTAPLDKQSYRARTIMLPREGKKLVIVDNLRAQSTMYYPAKTADVRAKGTNPNCAPKSMPNAAPTMLGQYDFLGFKVFKYEHTSKRPGQESIKWTYWYAPDLDSTALKFLAERRADNGILLTQFERYAEFVVLGEPDPSLFVVPDTYRELPPSAVQHEYYQIVNPEFLVTEPALTEQRMDAKYHGSQQFKP